MKNKSTGLSPSELLYGVNLLTPATWVGPAEIDDLEGAIMERIEFIKTDLPELRNAGISRMVEVKQREKEVYDKSVQSKLEELWEGPYRILKKLDKGTYIIEDEEGNRDLVHGDRLKLFYKNKEMIPEVGIPLRSKLKRFRKVLNVGV
ncbi:hypothetical protein BB558_002484 [Smittium angustum]|uniref:Integrase p58-like C-terminal domain-containing protein n=1 Tax=Smittium angustum TaxID=133377 RepID=A0A2U1J8J5_SMIAN|nr:hypothetical protein BB558_002484 [Smittium angustum]